MADIGEIKVRGVDYTVDVDANGIFTVDAGPAGKASGLSMEALRSDLEAKTRKAAARIQLPATRIENIGPEVRITDVVFTGIHGRTNHILYRDANGKAQQIGFTAEMSKFFQHMPRDSKRTAAELIAAANDAVRARDAFLEQFSFQPNLREVINAEIEKAGEGPAGE